MPSESADVAAAAVVAADGAVAAAESNSEASATSQLTVPMPPVTDAPADDPGLTTPIPVAPQTAPPAPASAIVATDLTHRFGDLSAVDHVSFDVAQGEVFGLVGPDGAGKSTLIRLLATVLAPDDGDALVFGESVLHAPQRVKPRIGYMSQRFSLYSDLTVQENLAFFARLRGVPRAERAARAKTALEFAGLSAFAKRFARHLSGGMKQKLALAVTLMHEPDLLLLDEPTTGVDPVSRREFWRIISDLHRRGITVFVATPYMDEAERCTRVAFMDGGRVELCDTPRALKASVPGRLLEIVVSDPHAAIPVLREVPGVTAVMVFGDALRVLVDESGPTADDLARTAETAGIGVTRATETRIDMEVAFSFLVEQRRLAGVLS
jgi:ABC-2 type transport system ATP-binding protein